MLVSRKLLFRRFLVRLFFTTLLLTYLLSACGLKGPLYLPLPKTDEVNRTSPNEAEKK
ncbi:lipoprotein [Nitrosomonas sp.]|uniref:LPS translocon maturation chaperone LptM n=1 Tax=Nitrosomonas sp. TaxID=42353 RepID=UPI00342F32E0